MSKISKYIHKTVYKNIPAPPDEFKEEDEVKQSKSKQPPKIVELELSDSEEIFDSDPDESGQEDEIEEEDPVYSLNNIHGTFERALRTATFDDFWSAKPQGFLK